MKIIVTTSCALLFLTASHAAIAAETNVAALQSKGSSLYESVLKHQRDIGEKFKWGDTNTPLLILEWFETANYVQSCNVSRDGVAAKSDGPWYGHGTFATQLDSNQLKLLAETIGELPPGSALTPKDRWILISGIRSNEWFTQIYDRADIPLSVERLSAIVGARLHWIVGDSDTTTNIAGRFSDTWVNSLQAANKAPIAVSTGAVASGQPLNSIQLWDTKNWKEIMIPAVEEFTSSPWSAAALSSDGKIVVIGAQGGARAVDLSTGKIQWDVKLPLNDYGRVVKQYALVQEEKFLAVAFQNSIEMWDSVTGKKLDILVTNEPAIDFVKASRDGKLLAVVSNRKKVQIWDMEKRAVIRESIDDPRYVYAIEFSPDDNYLAISGALYDDSFILWDLKVGNKTIIPVRGVQYFDEIGCLAWSADGNFFAATPQSRESLIFDAHTWKPITRWIRGADGAGIIFANDGTLLARLKDGSLQALNVSNIKSLAKP